MAKVTYASTSPYFTSQVEDNYLGTMNNRSIPKQADDQQFTITITYQHRPDLLAQDLYDDPGLWWVFAQRNMDVIKDPVYDMIAGTEIYLPKGESLATRLGI